jgi:hypothetical protein
MYLFNKLLLNYPKFLYLFTQKMGYVTFPEWIVI